MAGILYIVATPIGNLGDISFRAVEVLRSVHLIASEDTRTTKRLLNHFGIKTPLTSYFEGNERLKAEKIMGELKSGRDVALVSEAGTPTISDPGYRVVSISVENGIKVVPIPGPTAAIAALSASGLPTDRFMFVGFLPDKRGKRKKRLDELKGVDATLIFYISKWKLEKTLRDMLEALGDRRCSYARELTKLHEEIRHTTLSELSNQVVDKSIKGEITLVVSSDVVT